jgi:predicted AAA+ superfamily ATPase
MADLERTLRPIIEKTAKGFRVLLLTGQRQVGKTTLLKNMAGEKRSYVSLDDMEAQELAKSDPELFLQQYPPPVIIDEIQYAPQLFPYIKIYADERRERKGAFWLTGSQKYTLMQGVQESLAGRIAILDLMGLSYREKIKKPFSGKPFLPSMDKSNDGKKLSINDLYRHIWEGALPEPYVNRKLERNRYYSSYIKSYIERDVRDFYNLEKTIQFFNFLSAAASLTGQLLNYSAIARDIGIDVKTAQVWMGILEKSGLVYLLHPYSPNITKRIIKMPKIYFLDTGLCVYLTKWMSPETLMMGAMAGSILETYAVGEVLKSYFHNGREPAIYFYRDKNQNEVDLVLEENGTLYPIEIKKTASPGQSDYKSFRELEKLKKNVGLGAVLCLKAERMPLSREVVSIPVWEI